MTFFTLHLNSQNLDEPRNAVVTHLTELVLHFLDPPDFWGINCGSIWLSFFLFKFFFVLVLEENNDKIN